MIPFRTDSLLSAKNRLGEPSNIISQYDRLFQTVAYETGVDWHLLSAIAYSESKYQPGVKSRNGAIGLMQIMPTTAKYFNVPLNFLFDPFLNVYTSAVLLKKIEASFNLVGASEEDKIKILLAGYNSGIANLREARLMAMRNGADYNTWEQLKFYGKINNKQTRSYVTRVMQKLNEYKVLAASF